MINQFNILLKIKKKGIKHILFHTIPWKLKIRLDGLVFFISKKLFISFPLKDVIIIESHNDFDSNGGAFYNYLIENRYNKKYKIVWFLRNECPNCSLPYNVRTFNFYKPSFRKSYYYCVARYIICGHIMIPSIRDGQISYYTTHGGFSLKNFKGNVTIPKNMTYILTPNPTLDEILADGYMIDYPNNKMISIGFPVHDVLYTKDQGDLKKLTKKQYKKVILWMPTFRKSISGREDGSMHQQLGIPIINTLDDYRELNSRLSVFNALLIIKIHPMQDVQNLKISSDTNIKLLDGKTIKQLQIDNYRLMKDADALISDYSSSAYDFLHLDRPIAYTVDDAKEYKLGFLVKNPKDYMAGQIIYNFDDFTQFIKNVLNDIDDYKNQRKQIFSKIWAFHDGKSCERLAEHMKI